MEVKLFEVRDRATFIPCFGILMAPTPLESGPAWDHGPDGRADEKESYLLRRAGFGWEHGLPLVLFGRLEADECQYDPYSWTGARTMQVAHDYITTHWSELRSGDVVDVEFILGEAVSPKKSERETR